MTDTAWTTSPRVASPVDYDSWTLPYAGRLVAELRAHDRAAQLFRDAEDLPERDMVFLLGCVRIVPNRVFSRSRFSLVVHVSDLSKGRGFSPMTWQFLEGAKEIPICLFYARLCVRGNRCGTLVFRDCVSLGATKHIRTIEISNLPLVRNALPNLDLWTQALPDNRAFVALYTRLGYEPTGGGWYRYSPVQIHASR